VSEPILITRTELVRRAVRLAHIYPLATSDWPGFFDKAIGNPDIAGVFKLDGDSFLVRVENDASAEPPWEQSDQYGVVSAWVRRPRRPGELILNQDRGSFRYYDFRASVRKARKVWGCPNAGHGARKDFERLRAWCQDHWHYIRLIVVPLNFRGEPITELETAIWGIESDAGVYLAEAAQDLARRCWVSLPREMLP